MEDNRQKYRLVTRSNLDGLVSAVLLKKLDMLDDMLFVHPKEVQDGNVEITKEDIVTNLPYVKSAHMAFDHRFDSRDEIKLNPNHILFTDASSVSEIIYEYYGEKEVFSDDVLPLITAANKSKNADYTKEEILEPKGWELLSFLTDPRTGLGRFRDFKISNYELMKKLVDQCAQNSISEVLASDDVKERIELYHKYEKDFVDQLKRCVAVEGDIAVIDLREEEIIYPGNRFVVYALFPEVSASVHIFQGVGKQNTVFALGKSIFNKNNEKNIYDIVSKYGGGGHSDAGTCQVVHAEVDTVCIELVDALTTKQYA
ncbi:MAG TPA: exopolyphosphatase [Campylobacterales bacterium]|nr:exopolyphosphatase [Campylobacterales bacterium]